MEIEVQTGYGEEEGIWYAPEYRGNREKPSEARAEVLIVPMTGAELKQHQHAGLGRVDFRHVKDQVAAFEERQWRKNEKLLLKRLRGFRNFFRKDEHGVRRGIQTAREFIDSVLAAEASMVELLDELVDAILDRSRLTEGSLGNSSSPSASCSLATSRPGDGDASGADEPMSTRARHPMRSGASPETAME